MSIGVPKRGNGKPRPLPPPENPPSVGHVWLDARRRLLYCLNDTARLLQAEGVPFTSLDLSRQPLLTLTGTKVQAGEMPLERAWREGGPRDATFLLLRKGDAPLHLHWTAAPMSDGGGQVFAVVGSVSLRPPDPDWQVLAGLAHDLRSPLHALKLLANLALDPRTPNGEVPELLERLRLAAEHALSVGSDLLEWCRVPATGGRHAEFAWVPLEPFLVALAQEQGVMAGNKGLRLLPNFEAARGWDIHTDQVRLNRLLTNLLINAVRYTSAGVVEFRAWWRDDDGGRQLLLRVSDTGSGITPEEHESIFQPFERGTAGRGDSSGGSGLGLAVVERLVEELRLLLEVHSEYGQGSTFDLVIPGTLLRQGSP